MYINLLDQKEPKLNLENAETFIPEFKNEKNIKNKEKRKIIKPTEEELQLHSKYLKKDLQKNFFN